MGARSLFMPHSPSMCPALALQALCRALWAEHPQMLCEQWCRSPSICPGGGEVPCRRGASLCHCISATQPLPRDLYVHTYIHTSMFVHINA